MSVQNLTDMSLDEIYQLAHKVMCAAGCDEANAAAIADTVMRAERDGSTSHGLFRIPGYVGSIRSGKVTANASPKIEQKLASVLKIDGQMGYAPLALQTGLPLLAEAAHKTGIAVMSIVNSFHFAAYGLKQNILPNRGW